MATQPTETAPPQKRRRWLPRIALRTLLVLVTLLAIGLAWIGNAWHRVQRQRQIVKQIEAAGGKAHLDYRFITEGSLDFTLDADPDTESWVNELSFDPKVPASRYKTDGRRGRGRVLERQVETPRGPWLLRRTLGDDVFSYVEVVDFFNWETEPQKIDPHVLLDLPRLKLVVLTGSQVNDESLGVLAQVPELRSVALFGSKSSTATARGLAMLRQAKDLECLVLHGDWASDELLRGIGELRQLKSLSIAQTPNLTSAEFAHLGQLTGLEQLIMVKVKNLDDQQTAHLSSLQKLRALWLIGTSIGDNTIKHIATLKEVEYLLLDENDNISDRGGERLARLRKLKILSLANTNVGDRTARALSGLPQIWRLNFGGTDITNDSSNAFGSMTQLQSLDLNRTAMSDEGLPDLASLQHLEELWLGPNVSLSAASVLRKRLPDCEVTRFGATGGSLPDYNPPAQSESEE